MTYAPQGKPSPVVKSGEFTFAAAHLDHGHIYGQCNGLIEAGAELKWVYDPDPKKIEAFVAKYPQAKIRPSSSSAPPPSRATAAPSAAASWPPAKTTSPIRRRSLP